MIGFSVALPKQYTTCSVNASGTICHEYIVKGGSICLREVSPMQSGGNCFTKSSFWQFTQFWLFDLGIVGLVIIISSIFIIIATMVGNRRNRSGR